MEPAHRLAVRALDRIVAILGDASDHPQAVAAGELALAYAREIAHWTESPPTRAEAARVLERVLVLKEQVNHLLLKSTRSRRL